MKKKLSKILSILVIIGVLFTSSFTLSYADSKTWSWNYDTSSKTLYITGSGRMDDYSTKKDPYLGVSNDKQPWIKYSKEVKHIVIGDDITYIGQFAFYATGETDLKLGKKVEEIGFAAFQENYSLKKITFNKELKKIDRYAFEAYKNLNGTTIIIPSTVEYIGVGAFNPYDDRVYAIKKIVVPENATLENDETKWAEHWQNGIKTVVLADENYYKALNAVNNLSFKTRTKISKTASGKKCIKVYAEGLDVSKITDLGYTIKYDFYSSTTGKDFKKTKVVNKREPKYTNTAVKKGKKYYYKILVKVYDKNGKYLFSSKLSKTNYGVRTFK